uniref:Uncharacterized protein n=1 Tax=Arundo donax TaxID=35708 RepID=A0A0A9BSY0_ARUDO
MVIGHLGLRSTDWMPSSRWLGVTYVICHAWAHFMSYQ